MKRLTKILVVVLMLAISQTALAARFGLIDQYFDDSGSPLISGKMYFYEPGTTTPKTTYSDVSQTIANTNPVILSASGRQPDIFFTGSAKVVLTDSDDVVLETVDPAGGDTLSASEVKTLYESNANTNAYTDAEQSKLSAIEALADVTDETNVKSALDGATITSVTPASDDEILLQDTSDSDNLKTAPFSSFAFGAFDYTTLANGEYVGFTISMFTGSSVAAYKAVGRNGTTSNNRTIQTSLANSISYLRPMGITLAGVSSGYVDVLMWGFVRNTAWSWSDGDDIYLSQTVSGELTSTRPVSGQAVLIGIAMDSDILYIFPQMLE